MIGFWGEMASAGPYANNLHLAPCRQITTPTPHHSIFYRPDALPDAQPTVSKRWRRTGNRGCHIKFGRGSWRRLRPVASASIDTQSSIQTDVIATSLTLINVPFTCRSFKPVGTQTGVAAAWQWRTFGIVLTRFWRALIRRLAQITCKTSRQILHLPRTITVKLVCFFFLKIQVKCSARLYTLTTWHCPHSPAALLCAVQQSIGISCRPAPGKFAAAMTYTGTDRWTDGRTHDRCIEPCSACTKQAVPLTCFTGIFPIFMYVKTSRLIALNTDLH